MIRTIYVFQSALGIPFFSTIIFPTRPLGQLHTFPKLLSQFSGTTAKSPPSTKRTQENLAIESQTKAAPKWTSTLDKRKWKNAVFFTKGSKNKICK